MQKLNELVKLANKLNGEAWRYTRTSNFSNGYITGKDGRTIVETYNGDVPANACRFIEMADPETILTIAEHVRELEQSAQADAEYAKAGWKCAGEVATECDELKQKLVDTQQRAEAAEAKLAELDKQEAIFQVEVSGNHWLNAGPVDDSDFTGLPDGVNLLYAQPAPAVNLADLVPPQLISAMSGLDLPDVSIGDKAIIGRAIEVLRNIEEAK